MDSQLPSCFSLDHFVVGYSVDASPRIDVTVQGNTFSTVVNVQRSGPPSVAAAGRHSATVTGVISSRIFGEATHTIGGTPSTSSGGCNQIQMVLAMSRPPRLVEIKGSSSTGGFPAPGSQIIVNPPSAPIQSATTIRRGLQVTWQITSQPACATIANFIVTARVMLTDGSVRESTVTVKPDARSVIVPILTETLLAVNQNPLEIQSVEEVIVHASTRASLNVRGSYRSF